MKIFSKQSVNKEVLSDVKKLDRGNFILWLYNNYQTLRVYHAARPTDVNSYYQNGFLPGDIDQSLNNFETLLQNVNYTGPQNLRDTIDTFKGISDRFIYFILDKYDFYDRGAHYWIYGSEFMLCLAQNTASYLKDYLKKTGVPTIFTCDIPFSQIQESELIGLYDRIQNSSGTFEQMLYDIFSNYTIIIEPSLAGAYIVEHEHPTERVQDFHGGGYYRNDISTCPMCELKLD